MPEVELLELNRLNIGGAEMYHKGVRTPVDPETALRLSRDPRFRVTGLNSREVVEYAERQSRPRGEDLYAAISEAADSLDVDDDSNFDRQGKPSVDALSRALGYPVTVEERDAALKVPKPKLEAAESASRAAKPPGNLKIRTAPAAAAPERAVDM